MSSASVNSAGHCTIKIDLEFMLRNHHKISRLTKISLGSTHGASQFPPKLIRAEDAWSYQSGGGRLTGADGEAVLLVSLGSAPPSLLPPLLPAVAGAPTRRGDHREEPPRRRTKMNRVQPRGGEARRNEPRGGGGGDHGGHRRRRGRGEAGGRAAAVSVRSRASATAGGRASRGNGSTRVSRCPTGHRPNKSPT